MSIQDKKGVDQWIDQLRMPTSAISFVILIVSLWVSNVAPVQAIQEVNLKDQVSIKYSGHRYNHRNQKFLNNRFHNYLLRRIHRYLDQDNHSYLDRHIHRILKRYKQRFLTHQKQSFQITAQITNTSKETLYGPLSLAIGNTAPSSVTLINSNGISPNGLPTINLALKNEVLAPGQTTKAVFRFNNPENRRFTFDGDIWGTRTLFSEPGSLPFTLQVDSITDVHFSVNIFTSAVLPEEVILKQLPDFDPEVKEYFLNDTGVNGDTKANDGIYGATISVDTFGIPARSCLRYQVETEVNEAIATSTVHKVCLTSFNTSIAKSDVSASNIIDLADELALNAPALVLSDSVIMEFADELTEEDIAAIAAEVNGIVVGTLLPLNEYQIRLEFKLNPAEMINLLSELKTRQGVKDVYPDGIGFGAANEQCELASTLVTCPDLNDPRFVEQDGLDTINAKESWAFSKGEGIRIGVVDSGVNANHEDLTIEDLNTNTDQSSIGHGTGVVGIIGANHNDKGIAGVTSNATIRVYSALTDNDGDVGQLIGAISRWSAKMTEAANDGAQIINLSLGTALPLNFGSQPLCNTVRNFTNGKLSRIPTIFVAAAGNLSSQNGCDISPVYPAACRLEENANNPYLISVANSANDDTLFDDSCFGSWVDVAAPGTDIYTTTKSGNYSRAVPGTSFSAPMVTGAVAILLKRYPGKIGQIKSALQNADSAYHNLLNPSVSVGRGGIEKKKRIDILAALKVLNDPPSITNVPLSIDENTGNGPTDLTVAASDPEGDNLTYEITGGNERGAFSINNAGVISVNNSAALDYETTQSFTLNVEVTDDFGATAESEVTIALNDLPDNSPVITSPALVSINRFGTATGNGASSRPSINSDATLVVFQSDASDLVEGDNNGFRDIFIRDITKKTTSRISRGFNGQEANGNNLLPTIDRSGRYVTFTSEADNLVEGDTNGVRDIFVYDIQDKKTTRVSVHTNGTEGNKFSTHSDISGNGQFITFYSQASNLVDNDLNIRVDIFIHNLESGDTSLASIANNGDQISGPLGTFDPKISDDGQFITYISGASNIVEDDNNGARDTFIFDRIAQQTGLVSIGSGENQTDNFSSFAHISGDGRVVAFSHGTSETRDIFVHERETGETSKISMDEQVNVEDGGINLQPNLNRTGRFIGYQSSASNLVAQDTNGVTDVFVYDLETKKTIRISINNEGEEGNKRSVTPDMSDTGRFVVFGSEADNLIAGIDENNTFDIFIYDSNIE